MPLVITKNGYAEAVMMSVKLYEEIIAKVQTTLLINEALEEATSGLEPIGAKEFFDAMRAKYGK